MIKDFCKRANKPCRTEEESAVKAAEKGFRSYQCEFCGTWHLTSKLKKIRPAIREREEMDYG